MSLISLLVAESETNFGDVISSTQEPKEPLKSASSFFFWFSERPDLNLGPSLIQESSQTLPPKGEFRRGSDTGPLIWITLSGFVFGESCGHKDWIGFW